MSEVTLYIPDFYHSSLKDELPNLCALLQRAEKKSLAEQEIERTYADFFQVRDTHIPWAALIKNGQPGEYWFRADPVSLQQEMTNIYMLGNDNLTLSKDEAKAIIQALSPLMKKIVSEVEVIGQNGWYMQLQKASNFHSTPLNLMIGKSIISHLPDGSDKKFWQQLLTEMQMVLYDHPINTERSEQGKATVDSLWLWGAGCLPINCDADWDLVVTDSEMIAALAKYNKLASVPPQKFLNRYDYAFSQQKILLVLENFQSRLEIEEKWFALLLKALKSKWITDLSVQLDQQWCFQVSPKKIKKWWHQHKPWQEHWQ